MDWNKGGAAHPPRLLMPRVSVITRCTGTSAFSNTSRAACNGNLSGMCVGAPGGGRGGISHWFPIADASSVFDLMLL